MIYSAFLTAARVTEEKCLLQLINTAKYETMNFLHRKMIKIDLLIDRPPSSPIFRALFALYYQHGAVFTVRSANLVVLFPCVMRAHTRLTHSQTRALSGEKGKKKEEERGLLIETFVSVEGEELFSSSSDNAAVTS